MMGTDGLRTGDARDRTTPAAVHPALFVWVMMLKLLRVFSDYRKALFVEELLVFPNGSGYFLCPRCRIPLEREFMSYCDRCGQHLGWRGYKKAKIVHPDR